MGETDDDVIDLAYATRHLGAESVPVNFLHPIVGTPLGACATLDPRALFENRVPLSPAQSAQRSARGRSSELNLGARQADIFNAVNSIFVNGYLTTTGWGIGPTRELIEGAGFEVEVELPPAV